MGVDYVIIFSLNESNKHLSPSEFNNFLKKLNINKILVGPDFHYGSKASGDIKDLEKEFKVEVIDFLCDGNHKLSSRDIREALDHGNLEIVKQILGRDYHVYGVVVKGDQLGRTIGFPTANLECECYLPHQGVYVTKTEINGKIYPSITNIGIRPTISTNELRNETHVLNFEGNLYGEKIKVFFTEKMREEIKFKDLDELQKQIKIDVEKRRSYDN